MFKRNKPGKIILVYDDDEKISPGVATTLVQRGYDNLFMLSGGEYLFRIHNTPSNAVATFVQSTRTQRLFLKTT